MWKESYAHRLFLQWFNAFIHLEPYHRCALRLFFSRIVKPLISFSKKSTFLPCKSLLCLHDKQNNRWSLADMELLFSCSTRYQEIITVYILLLDTLLVRFSRSRDNNLNIQREILYQITPKYYSLFIEWRQNSWVCHTASIQKIP